MEKERAVDELIHKDEETDRRRIGRSNDTKSRVPIKTR
jgi:hypothetical protein